MGNREGVKLVKLSGNICTSRLRFTETERDMLEEIADSYGVSMNTILRALIRAAHRYTKNTENDCDAKC